MKAVNKSQLSAVPALGLLSTVLVKNVFSSVLKITAKNQRD